MFGCGCGGELWIWLRSAGVGVEVSHPIWINVASRVPIGPTVFTDGCSLKAVASVGRLRCFAL